MNDLSCDHVEGRLQLLDALGSGTLDASRQVKLARLLDDDAEVPEEFDSLALREYEWERISRNQIWETWTCPECDATHADYRDDAIE